MVGSWTTILNGRGFKAGHSRKLVALLVGYFRTTILGRGRESIAGSFAG